MNFSGPGKVKFLFVKIKVGERKKSRLGKTLTNLITMYLVEATLAASKMIDVSC